MINTFASGWISRPQDKGAPLGSLLYSGLRYGLFFQILILAFAVDSSVSLYLSLKREKGINITR